MSDNEVFQEIVAKIMSNNDDKALGDFINEKTSLFTSEQKFTFLNTKTENGLSLLEISANQSPEDLQIVLNSNLVVGLEESSIYAVINVKNHYGHTLLEQAARTSPNHIKAILNSSAFLKLSSEYQLKSLIEKNQYDISFIEYALKHESSAFIKSVFASAAVQNISGHELSQILSIKDSNDIEIFLSVINLSVEHFKVVFDKDVLHKLPEKNLNNLLLEDHIDGNNLLSFTAFTQTLSKFNILLDRYNDFHLPSESLLKLFTHQNYYGKQLIEIVISKGPDYISSLFNHDIIYTQLNPMQQFKILTTYSQNGEPVLISTFNLSPEHVKAIITSNTFLNLSPNEVIQVFDTKDQSGDTFLEILHAKGSEDYVKVLQNSEVFHSLNHELQSQILEQIGISYDD